MREEHDPNMRIRRALPDDAFSIAAVLHRSFVEYESCYTPDAFAATVSAPGKIQDRMNEGPVWVALKDETVVGTAAAVPKSDRLYIRGMAVDPAARGGRIGWKLLECAEEFAIESGFNELFLSTTPFLSRAIRLYEQYGFSRSREGPDDLYGTPLFTMVKTLPRASERRQAKLENTIPGDNH